MVEAEALTFIHNYIHKKLPKIFDNYFVFFNEINNINTRGSKNQIKIDVHKTNMGKSSMKISGAQIWNKTSTNLKTIKDIKLFRKNIKSEILPSYNTN